MRQFDNGLPFAPGSAIDLSTVVFLLQSAIPKFSYSHKRSSLLINASSTLRANFASNHSRLQCDRKPRGQASV